MSVKFASKLLNSCTRNMSTDFNQIRAIIANLSILFVLILAVSNLKTKYYVKTPSAAREANSGRLSTDDKFVWSAEWADWALENNPQLGGGDGDDHDDDLAKALNRSLVDSCLWPEQRQHELCSLSDRIINQLLLPDNHSDKLFKISIANDNSLPEGRELFIKDKCLVNKCLITQDLGQADAVVFPNADVRVEIPEARRADQIWIAHFLESPPNTFDERFSRPYRGRHAFNWTASYRSDSDLVTPYSKFVPYLGSVGNAKADELESNQRRQFYQLVSAQHRALIEAKQTKVAWFVSNCHAKNNRLEFAKQLAKHIQVDVYGKCGNLTCSKWTQDECLSFINRHYKFYLAFENSNSREYITEKFYRNALGYNEPDHLLLPIVMGPPRQDYVRLAPPGSFIHVDEFRSAQDLAAFLLQLGQDNARYYSYFRWKTLGRFVETKFMCRICSMLHKSRQINRVKTISNLKDWWLGEMAQRAE